MRLRLANRARRWGVLLGKISQAILGVALWTRDDGFDLISDDFVAGGSEAA
jgi:hypothetical protein